MTLTDFLLARIAEDEAATRAQIEGTPIGSPAGELLITLLDQKLIYLDSQRRVVELHSDDHECPAGDDSDLAGWFDLADGGCPTLRAAAAAYADHPDFQEAWRPTA